jgi:hypothetical protein
LGKLLPVWILPQLEFYRPVLFALDQQIRALTIELEKAAPSALPKGMGALSSVVISRRSVIGNVQQWLIGTYHGVSRDQLQSYLDEFVFRHNDRRQPIAAFQTLLGLGAGRTPTPYELIRGAKAIPKLPPKAEPQYVLVAETIG